MIAGAERVVFQYPLMDRLGLRDGQRTCAHVVHAVFQYPLMDRLGLRVGALCGLPRRSRVSVSSDGSTWFEGSLISMTYQRPLRFSIL